MSHSTDYTKGFREIYEEFEKIKLPLFKYNQSVNIMVLSYEEEHEIIYPKITSLVTDTKYGKNVYGLSAYKNCIERCRKEFYKQASPKLKEMFLEWYQIDYRPKTNIGFDGTCGLCGQKGLRDVYFICHIKTGAWLGVGSTCIKRCHWMCYSVELGRYCTNRAEANRAIKTQKLISKHEIFDNQGNSIETIHTTTTLHEFESFLYFLNMKTKTPYLVQILKKLFFSGAKKKLTLGLCKEDIEVFVSAFQSCFSFDPYKKFNIVEKQI